jgi:hypothetical protein
MNYDISRLVLSSFCVGAFGAGGFWLCSFCRLNFSLQNEHHQKPPAPKAPKHNELRTRRLMW